VIGLSALNMDLSEREGGNDSSERGALNNGKHYIVVLREHPYKFVERVVQKSHDLEYASPWPR